MEGQPLSAGYPVYDAYIGRPDPLANQSQNSITYGDLPEEVGEDLFEQALVEATRKKELPAASLLRLERFSEGLAAQVMHIGPYATEGRRFSGCTRSSPTRAMNASASTTRST